MEKYDELDWNLKIIKKNPFHYHIPRLFLPKNQTSQPKEDDH